MTFKGIVFCTNAPSGFQTQNDQYIFGLNYEAMVKVFFPPPDWMERDEYTLLRCRDETVNQPLDVASFSLNLAIYSHAIVQDEWNDQWFLLTGRVHPFALTWTLEPDQNFPADEPMDFTVPTLTVRNRGYQP